jgi:hypothetical protein
MGIADFGMRISECGTREKSVASRHRTYDPFRQGGWLGEKGVGFSSRPSRSTSRLALGQRPSRQQAAGIGHGAWGLEHGQRQAARGLLLIGYLVISYSESNGPGVLHAGGFKARCFLFDHKA